MKAGRLYLLPTPIGDTPVYDVLPQRNREILSSLDYFVVENVRTARRFLSRAAIGCSMDELRFAELNEHTRPEEMADLLAPVLTGTDAGLMSEAGVPGVADPGADLVAMAHAHGVEVIPLVGPSSLILALMASGLNGQSFAFNGYLPIKQPERNKAIRFFEKRAQTEHQSQLFIEAPYRNVKLFQDFLNVCGEHTSLCVAIDLLQPDQRIEMHSISQWRKRPVPDLQKRPAIFILG